MTNEHCPTCGSVVSVVTTDEGTSSYRPRLLTDEMVERAARAVHEVSDDVLPFDLPIPKGMGRREERARQRGIDVRRERYLTAARAALEAALGNREERYTPAQVETIHDLAIDRAECYVSPEAALRAHERAQSSRPMAPLTAAEVVALRLKEKKQR